MKEIKIIKIATLLIVSTIACKNNNSQNIEIKMGKVQTLDVVVENKIDPVCEMEIPKFLKDTITYAGHLYGFCSEMCTKSFLDDPEKYLEKIK